MEKQDLAEKPAGNIDRELNTEKMEERIQIQELEPEAYKAMQGLETYLNAVQLSPGLRELIKIRASQINGCAYCIELHTKDALKIGENQRRIFALSAWWESPLFNVGERAVLKMTEEVTLIADKGLSKETYEQAKAYFSDHEIAQMIMQIGIINLWNRMAVATHKYHKEY